MKTRSGEKLGLQLLEEVLDALALVGEEAVGEIPHQHLAVRHPVQERLRAPACLIRALALAAQDHPAHLVKRLLLDQLEQGAGAPDLDVVGVGTEGEHAPGRPVGLPERERQHHPDAARSG